MPLFAFTPVLPMGEAVHIICWVAFGCCVAGALIYLFGPWRPPTASSQGPLARMDSDGNVEVFRENMGASVNSLPGGGWAIHVDRLHPAPTPPPTFWDRMWHRGTPPPDRARPLAGNVFAEADYDSLDKEHGWHKETPAP